MSNVHVWPGLKPDGTSITVLAEDGVTPIPADGGALVPYAPYYTELMSASQLLTYDPLGLSGDPISVPSITRVSSSLVGQLTAALTARAGLSDGELVETSGYAAPSDGGGRSFRFAQGISAGADGYDRINCGNGQWQATDATVFEALKFGAVAGDTGNQAPAIQAAIDAAAAVAAVSGRARVIVRGGTFRTTQKITARNSVTVEFVDAILHATSDCGFELVTAQYTIFRDVTINCDAGVTGFRVRWGVAAPSSGPCLYPRFENCSISLASSGAGVGIDFDLDGTGGAGGDVCGWPRIINPKITISGGANALATGIRMRGGATNFSNSIGGLIEGGDISWVGKGIDLDNCDTWRIRDTSLHGIMGGAVTATPGGGNVGNGTCTALTWNGTQEVQRRAMAGQWTLTCTTAVANGGVWKLTNRLGSDVATGLTMTPGAGAATAFSVAGMQFTLTDGSSNFAVGDTFAITVPDTAAITFGPYTSQCQIKDARLEDCDRDIRFVFNGTSAPLACRVDVPKGFGMAVNVFDVEAGAVDARHVSMEQLAENNESMRYGRRQVFGNTLELGCYEERWFASGDVISSLADNSGVASPRVRLTAPVTPGPVTISGINSDVDRAPGDPIQGDLKIIHQTVAHPVTLRHEDGAVPSYKRISTLSGADEVYAGPCVLFAIKDKTRNGAGSGRFIPLGQLDRTQYRFGSVTTDVASIAAGAVSADVTITVTGAVLGDFVELSCSLDLAGLHPHARVSAADTVKFSIHNPTAGAIDLASATFYARVRKR